MIGKLARPSVVLLMTISFVLAKLASASGQDASPITETQQDPPKIPAPVLEDAVDEDLGYRPLMQGPVHEAFAAPIDLDLTDGVRVFAEAPPEPVNEQPPEARPEDGDMKWIPGYWTWSDEQNGYVWVSGLWRKLPPDRTWTPGYWSKTSSGYRWTSGYWSRGQTSSATAEYLPMPPKSIDNGPSVPPPGEDYFWVPGHWEYVGADYRWRGGFWSAQHSGWVWQPACYLYTPNGYLSVDGYWDYAPQERAELYAPITFYNPVYLQPSYVYRPRYPLIGAASLLLNLFVRSGYPHYYYGNFYGPSYSSFGYRPWYDLPYGYGYSSPWFGYYDWKYRKSGINFGGSMQHYKNDLHVNSHQHGSARANADRFVVGKPSRGSSAAPTDKRFTRSLDDVVRSHRSGSAINRNAHSERSNSPNRSSIDREFSRSPGNFDRSGGGFRGSTSRDAPNLGFSGGGSPGSRSPSMDIRSGFSGGSLSRSSIGVPSSSARRPTSDPRLPTANTRIPSSNIRVPSSNIRVPSNLGRSSSFPSMRSGTLPSSTGRGTISPSPSMRSGNGVSSQSSRSFRGRSPSSLSPRSSGSSFGRGPSQSFNRGGSSSGSSGGGNMGGSHSGGSNRGHSGGGSKSMGSRGHGKSK